MRSTGRRRIAGPEIYHRKVGSTNDEARTLALRGAMEGTTVRAKEQTAGYGRLSREWSSPSGGFFLSVILRPPVHPENAPQLALVAGIAVREALCSVSGAALALKWPNDILSAKNGQKICGILCESAAGEEYLDFAIVGIGINVNNDPRLLAGELALTATSIRQETGREIPLEHVLASVLEALDRHYTCWLEQGFSPTRKAWLAANCTIGNEVIVRDGDSQGSPAFLGVAEDLDERGGLIVRNRAGLATTFDYGEVGIRFAPQPLVPIPNSGPERNTEMP